MVITSGLGSKSRNPHRHRVLFLTLWPDAIVASFRWCWQEMQRFATALRGGGSSVKFAVVHQ